MTALPMNDEHAEYDDNDDADDLGFECFFFYHRFPSNRERNSESDQGQMRPHFGSRRH
jgi:hypothetical protein